MKNVQVRNVPDRVHRVLTRRAAEAGQSMQEYLLQLLTESAGRPSVKEVLDRAARRGRGARVGPDDIARIIREERQAREEELYRRVRPEQ